MHGARIIRLLASDRSFCPSDKQLDKVFEKDPRAAELAFWRMSGRRPTEASPESLLALVPTASELAAAVTAYARDMDAERLLPSCACCGVRDPEDEGYTRVDLRSCKCLIYDAAEARALGRMDEAYRLAVSAFRDHKAEVTKRYLYHVHPELVTYDGSGVPWFYACSACKAKLDRRAVPRYSVKMIDYGLASRIGLPDLTLAERIVIAPVRNLAYIVKLRSVHGTATQTTALKGHTICFPHDHTKDIGKKWDLMDRLNTLPEFLMLALVTPRGRMETVRPDLRGFATVRPSAILAHLRALRQLNPIMASALDGVRLPDTPEDLALVRACEAATRALAENAHVVSDEDLEALDRVISHDVAGVRDVDPGTLPFIADACMVSDRLVPDGSSLRHMFQQIQETVAPREHPDGPGDLVESPPRPPPSPPSPTVCFGSHVSERCDHTFNNFLDPQSPRLEEHIRSPSTPRSVSFRRSGASAPIPPSPTVSDLCCRTRASPTRCLPHGSSRQATSR